MFRYLQYFIIIFITSGISANYTHMLNHNKLRNLEREIEIQSKTLTGKEFLLKKSR